MFYTKEPVKMHYEKPIKSDTKLRSKSVRLDGVSTSIRLEEIFWEILDDIACEEGNDTSVNEVLNHIYNNVYIVDEDYNNFASILRMVCVRKLMFRIEGG